MTFLSRLLGREADPRDSLRPLWFRIVEISRLPEYYARCGVADTVEGRFDMVVHVLALVMLRMEKSRALTRRTAYLTELFVSDMDGQLRESGIGDIVVGKHMGRLMSALGGRLDALRQAFASGEESALAAALDRNVTWAAGGDPACLAARFAALRADLAERTDDEVLAGAFLR